MLPKLIGPKNNIIKIPQWKKNESEFLPAVDLSVPTQQCGYSAKKAVNAPTLISWSAEAA